MEEKLIGALIGLARATDGNEHLISSSATTLILEALAMPLDADAQHLLKRAEEEKRKMVPNCFSCANPCGRTADYDLSELQNSEPEIRELKIRILTSLHALAEEFDSDKEMLLYKGLAFIGMESVAPEQLLAVAEEIEK